MHGDGLVPAHSLWGLRWNGGAQEEHAALEEPISKDWSSRAGLCISLQPERGAGQHMASPSYLVIFNLALLPLPGPLMLNTHLAVLLLFF